MASPLFKTFDPDEALPAEIRGRAIRASAHGDGLTVEATFLVQPNGMVGGFLCELTEGLSLEERAALLELRARAVSGRWTPATVGKGIATETYASALACDARLAWEDAQ